MTTIRHAEIKHSDFERVLATRGVGGYHQYRIPALAVTTRGTLLAAYDGRPNLDDLPNPIDLLVRRSVDNGATWSAQEVLRTGTGLAGFGDPSLLVDPATGRIFCFHATGTKAGFFEAVQGLEPDDQIQHADVSFSDDDGVTWQHRRLTTALKRGSITGLFAAAGTGTTMHTRPFAGRLLQQYVVLAAGEILAATAYSDDHGETWTLGETVGPGTNENKTVALNDGTVLLHSRSRPWRLAAISTDGGHSYTNPEPQTALPDPGDNGSLCRFDGLPVITTLAREETDHWLLATHNHDDFLRHNTVLKLSTNNGASWDHCLTLCAGSSAYSTALRLPNGKIGVFYERQGYQELVFVSIDPAALLAAPTADAEPAVSAEPMGSQATARDSGCDLRLNLALDSMTPARNAQWIQDGEQELLNLDGGHWGSHEYKAVGQDYSAERPQVLATRRAMELNYGPASPGYRVGDILAFKARIRNSGTRTVTLTREEETRTLAPGAAALYPDLRYTVSDSDVQSGLATVTWSWAVGRPDADAEGPAQAANPQVSKTYTFDTHRGTISEG